MGQVYQIENPINEILKVVICFSLCTALQHDNDESTLPLCTDEFKNVSKISSLRVTVIKRQGSMLLLPCQFCGYEENDTSMKTWLCTSDLFATRRPFDYFSYTKLVPDDRVVLAENGALKIINLKQADTNDCHCTSATSTSNYKLHFIIDVEEDILIKEKSGSVYEWAAFQARSYVTVNLLLSKLNPTSQLKTATFNIRASPDWSEWSSCDPCDNRSTIAEHPVRRRKASCHLKSLEYPKTKSISGLHLIQIYDRGVSCISSRLYPTFPVQIRSALLIPTFVVIEKCNLICIRGQKQPEDIKKIVVYKVEEVEGSSVKLTCSGESVDTPIIWYNGTKRLNPTVIASIDDRTFVNATSDRVFVDATQTLHLIDLKVWDSNVYGCWMLRHQRASVHLIVAPRLKASWRHFVYVAMAVITSFIIYVVGIVIIGNHRLRSDGRCTLYSPVENLTFHEENESEVEVLENFQEPHRVQKFKLLKKLLDQSTLGF